jgi:predicted RNA-binding Zn ribbon-like protein
VKLMCLKDVYLETQYGVFGMAKATRTKPSNIIEVLLKEILYRVQRIEDRLVRSQGVATRRNRIEMKELDDLKAKVQANGDAEQAAVTLLEGLKTQLDAAIAANDTAALQELSDQLGQQTDALAAAVTANTPAA